MSEYGELNTSEKQDSSSEKKNNYRINRKSCYCIFFVFLLLILYSLCVFLPTFYVMPTSEDDFDFNFTADIIDSPPSSNDLTARLYSHSSRYTTCDDLKYGCCKIYSQCQIKEDYLDYDESQLAIRLITPNDRISSNCYSLDHLVHKWNIEYKDKEIDDCNNSTHGCCPSINTACDFSLRNKRGNNQDTIDFYKQHIHHSHRITVPKKDKEGSNCPSFGGIPTSSIVYAYNNGYPKPDDDIIPIISTLCSIACILCSLSKCKK